MQALIERAHDLGVLPTAKRTNLYKSLSARGWRTREPLSDQLPSERPELTTAIGNAMFGKGLNEQEVANMAGFAHAANNSLFPSPQRHHLRPLRSL
jgi:Zn-dependent peptidase ImmA (M78 family)